MTMESSRAVAAHSWGSEGKRMRKRVAVAAREEEKRSGGSLA